MEGRIGPITHPFDQTMPERIDMNVIHMRTKIGVIANQVFPVAALSYAPLTARHSNPRALLGKRYGLGKGDLDQPPTRRKVGIIGWKLDDAMKMLRQYHPAMDDEGMALPYHPHRLAQQVYIPRQ